MLDFESKPAPKISGSIDIQVEIEPVEFDDMPTAPTRARKMGALDCPFIDF